MATVKLALVLALFALACCCLLPTASASEQQCGSHYNCTTYCVAMKKHCPTQWSSFYHSSNKTCWHYCETFPVLGNDCHYYATYDGARSRRSIRSLQHSEHP